ncbi:MAG: YdcF family protein [Luteolibacter sp.]
MVWRFGGRDGAVKSDCVIVLGTAVDGGVPSPVFRERILHGVGLYKRGLAPKVIFTGGVGDGESDSESGVGRVFAIGEGVAGRDVLIEERSRTTMGNLVEAKKVMDKEVFSSAILVSDPLHMRRAIGMAEGQGMKVVSSPTPTSMYRSFRARAGFLLREVFFLHVHWLTGR